MAQTKAWMDDMDLSTGVNVRIGLYLMQNKEEKIRNTGC